MKTYKYIDGQGNLIGPASVASLRGLHKAGIVGDATQVIDEETNRCLTLEQVLAGEESPAGPAVVAGASTFQSAPATTTLPIPPPPPPVASATGTAGRKPGIPKIGKRGWVGVVILVLGLMTFLGANKSAEDLWHSTWSNFGSDRITLDESLAKGAGYNSYTDYLAQQNRQSGGLFSVIGLGLVIWGYVRHNSKKRAA